MPDSDIGLGRSFQDGGLERRSSIRIMPKRECGVMPWIQVLLLAEGYLSDIRLCFMKSSIWSLELVYGLEEGLNTTCTAVRIV